ncbi:DUF2357 domain-containing protein [Aquitalea aquatica]|uniref:DUF2357 domain-containing protein n=1 Tax=Aquitalea aquatica TaxID=3044273 RepID=A0A838YG26_9NEIS|nr:DUF2357 domain-containing protein [Aquitalea magnusonii]MBA4709694.1 DUF2357 domain-containing protein [Aquitalea magnusonii]
MTTLFMRKDKGEVAWRVWPDPEPVSPGTIQETGNYLFELFDAENAASADLLIDDVPLEALRSASPDKARWRWSPSFHAGTVEAELRLCGRSPLRFEIVTDPDLRKLTRDDFDAMLREILGDSFALFALSGFRKGVARGDSSRTPPIARLEFLRSRICELEAVVAGIVRSPRRLLGMEETVLPYHRAARATGPEIIRSFRSGRIAQETQAPGRLPASLKGFLPQQIRIRQRCSSLDLPEHRQIGACLRAWSSWLAAMAEQLDRSQRDEDPEISLGANVWSSRCKRLSRRVGQLASETPFVEAGDASPRLLLSSIFRNDPAYRRFYRLWQDINLGIASIFGEFLNLPLARTFDLYELWCFLRLVRAAAEAFGQEQLDIQDLFIADANGGMTLAAGSATVDVGAGWKLCFQKQYREFWSEPDGRGSYSRTMTPDIVAASEPCTAEESGRMIVLDAKYRIESGLNDALTSIHTYRDALVREVASGKTEGIVTAAYLLTPYLPALNADYRDTPMPGRLFHPLYRAGFQFGAVTLRPGMTLAQFVDVLKIIVEDAVGNRS